MLKFKLSSVPGRNFFNGTKHLVGSLVVGGVIWFSSHAAPASPVVNSISFNFRSVMTNTGLDPDASGSVGGSFSSRGSKEKQRLTINASGLNNEMTYPLVAFLDDSDTATAVSELVTDQRGGLAVNYAKGSLRGPLPLPAALDPLSNVRELDIVDGNGDIILGAHITDGISFSYSVKRAMDNAGFLTDAHGALQLSGNPKTTRVSVSASGLTPLTSYQLVVNGAVATTKTSDRRGKLNVAGPKTGLPLVLDIRMVALVDGAGGDAVLISNGLGIPGVFSTAHPDGVALGSAAGFAVLAGATVTSTGNTEVTGDVGVWAGSSVTGFAGIVPGGPGIVHGTINAGNSAAQIAQGDLTTAYNDAAGRTLAPVDVANADLGGRTLFPGLYKSSGTLALTGNVTLDAQGDQNAVFIFQIASALNTATGSQVILSGNARAANVYWQVGSSAVLATTTAFKGTIMADQSISLATGATLEGRALARIGAVTLDANVITIPTP